MGSNGGSRARSDASRQDLVDAGQPKQKVMSDYAAALGGPKRNQGWICCGKSGGWIKLSTIDYNTDEWSFNTKLPGLVRLVNKVFKYINVPGVCVMCGDGWIFEYWYRETNKIDRFSPQIMDPLCGKVCCDRCRSDDWYALLLYIFLDFILMSLLRAAVECKKRWSSAESSTIGFSCRVRVCTAD